MRIGAQYSGQGRCRFTVWSPDAKEMAVRVVAPAERMIPLEKHESGYWWAEAADVSPGALYFYRLEDGTERPDPASHSQPLGVHGPSAVVDHAAFDWGGVAGPGVALDEMIIYELHVGTFTPEGTFEAIIPRLDELRELGVNAVELMPVAQFPGERNWGYDGVYPFAVQNSYGGSEGLKRLVTACHWRGLAVILDVVYNHLGPEGNYLECFGPYFTDRYQTPWGRAVNFDGGCCSGVRNYFIENALHWLRDYHVDGLRLDAVHAVHDLGERHFLRELADRVADAFPERRRLLIAESDLNDARLVRPPADGGYGLGAMWCDDFHHSLRTLLTGERGGYYLDFGEVAHLAKAYREGLVYTGQYSPHRRRTHGTPAADVPGERFVVFGSNHDQVGNRMLGERLPTLIPFEALKLAAGAVLASPFVPLLFMGEEYGEEAPFLYFVSHSDRDLIEAVRRGRRREFAAFAWQGEPPDPQAVETFLESRLRWERRHGGRHRALLTFYRRMLRLRREIPALRVPDKDCLEAVGREEEKLLLLRRWQGASQAFCVMNFGEREATLRAGLPPGLWSLALDSAAEEWGGPGSSLPASLEGGQEVVVAGLSFALYVLTG